MEDGKRKKKNKKNKGKPNKAADNAAVGSGESPQTEREVNHESASEQNHQETDAGTVGTDNKGMPTETADDTVLGSEGLMQIGPEVNYESATDHKHLEPDTGIADTLSVSVRDSERELERRKIKESNFVELQGTIKDLQNNMVSCIEKEVSLEKKIELLQNENESSVKKEISWNLKLEQLQSEIHSCSIKEANLENRLNCMERENESRILKENLISEMVARLEEANTELQIQVKELEISKGNLVQENQQLTNTFSLLESRVQQLESETASFRSLTEMMTKPISEDQHPEKQVEPVYELSERLVTVETEVAEKVNRQNDMAVDPVAFHVSSLDAIAAPTTYLLPQDEIISEPTNECASSGAFFETISIADANVNGIANGGVHPKELTLLEELNGRAEIVQISLDDNQDRQDKSRDINDEKVVPFSDAPLIGAPFRLMSFVAKYVSGADLVEENRRNSAR